jgi:hypothetical protein
LPGRPVCNCQRPSGGREIRMADVMNSMVVARVRRKLEASRRAARTKRAIFAVGQRVLQRSGTRINESFPMFAPYSAGSNRKRAELTIQAVNQTFPLMLELLSRTGRRIEDPVPIGRFVDTDDKSTAATQLKVLYDRHGSDKATEHDYHLLYGAILAERDSVTALLEVGLGTNHPDVISNMGVNGQPGASLRAFRDFLPRARIYGADVDRRILFSEERIATFFVDQTDPRSFDAIADAVGENFDLIVDDGLHSPNANLATLLFGFERLKVGGWLVIEDITPAAVPLWQAIAALMPHQYNSQVVAAKGAFLFSMRRSA